MDWTAIISTLLAALIPTGGLLAIVTIKERKTALQINNQKSIADSYKQLADEYREREAKTQTLMASKEAEVLEQIRLNSSLRHKLDDAHTETAVCRIMYCRNSNCIQRDPPFGSGAEGVGPEGGISLGALGVAAVHYPADGVLRVSVVQLVTE